MLSFYLVLAGVLIYATWYVLLGGHSNVPRGLKPLPGPKPLPLIGNLGQFDPKIPYAQFQKWSEQYGGIFQLKMGSQTFISINDPTIAKELFEKRGTLYNSRHSTHVGHELLSEGRRITFVDHGPQRTAYRKQLHMALSISKTKNNQYYQELESRQLLQDFLDLVDHGEVRQPDYTRVQQIYRRYTASVMMTLTFGHRIKTLAEDKLVDNIFTMVKSIGEAVQQGRFLVDAIPALKRLPRVMRTWENWVDKELAWQWPFLKSLLQQVEDQMRRGVPNIGLMRMLVEQRKLMSIEERGQNFLDDKSLGFQSVTMMEAGAETTAVSMLNLTLAMLLHPEAQKKGQRCLDDVVGDRVPTFEDLPNLDFVTQIVKETMRWRPVITFGVPHSNTASDSYNGYHIPKDSVIWGNIWNMLHNPDHYQSHEDFIPERFDGVTKSAFEMSQEKDAMDRDHYIFGWGRRICIGMHLAEKSVLLVVARVLWAFDIVAAKDAQGKDIQVSSDFGTAYEHSVIASLKPFPVQFKMRSLEGREVIETMVHEAEHLWADLKLDMYKYSPAWSVTISSAARV